MDKPFKTIDEQLNILKSRGICFDNDQEAKKYLLINNYYNVVNCYGRFLKDYSSPLDCYLNGANFLEIVSIHQFDSQFKSSFLKSILCIENMFKSVLSYEFSKAYKSEINPYQIQTNYKQDNLNKVVKLQADLGKIISKYSNLPNDNSIKHYLKKHKNLPLWVLSDYMTFGQATTMYSLVSNNIRNCIAQDLGTIASTNQYQGNSQVIRLSPKNIDVIFGNFKDMRNLLAHDNMIFDEKFRTGFPYFKEIHNRFNIPADTAKQSVYDAFIMMRMFLTERQFAIVYNTALGAAKRLNNKLKVANTSAILLSIGFPSNFCSEERIKQPE